MVGTIPPCSYRFCTIYAHLNIMAFYAIIFSKEFISLKPCLCLAIGMGGHSIIMVFQLIIWYYEV